MLLNLNLTTLAGPPHTRLPASPQSDADFIYVKALRLKLAGKSIPQHVLY